MSSSLQVERRLLQPARPPVVLLGGLNLVRTLGLARIPAIVASPDPHAPALKSRYCRGRCPLPALENQREAAEILADAGARLAEAVGRPVPLFYGNDDGLSLVEAHRELLGARFSLALNEPEVAAALLDKEGFEQFAHRHGLPVPRTLDLSTARGWEAPLLVKPKRKMKWEHSRVHVHLFGRAGKARVFANGRAFAGDALAQQLAEELIIQEYVPGDDRQIWSFHGYADGRGEVLAWFIGRKLRTFPAHTGESTYLELARDPRLAQLGRAVAARVPLKGVFKMDFKKDALTGEWRLLEINARCNLWHYLAARNGLNLMKVAYDHLLHGARPCEPLAYRTRYRWLCLRPDYRAYRELSARGELSAGRWLASLLRPKVYELFSWTDPLPFLAACLLRVKRVPRLTVRLWRWLSTAS
jgi:predicted ATP-grasp superfamily ATP-dependent carboligase